MSRWYLPLATRHRSAPSWRCSLSAIELGDALSTATREIRDFNQSTSELTTQIIALNKRLVLATIVIALATAVAAGVAVLTAL